jgi:hypothetical protein
VRPSTEIHSQVLLQMLLTMLLPLSREVHGVVRRVVVSASLDLVVNGGD